MYVVNDCFDRLLLLLLSLCAEQEKQASKVWGNLINDLKIKIFSYIPEYEQQRIGLPPPLASPPPKVMMCMALV